MPTNRYYVYLRKSSESEERQELSIPAQREELQALVQRRGLQVLGAPLEESMSAKRPGRPLFSQMLDGIENGRADGIICWKLDRLARNPKDGGNLMWSLGQGAIKAIVTPERTYTGTGDDKLLMSIIFGMATKYSDDLSDNVKRGQREALRQGRWPHSPKLGYVRDPETKELLPDPDRFEVVQQLWRHVLRGTPPLDVLALARTTWGLTTPERGRHGGHLLSKSRFYKLLHDPFYMGVMSHGGETAAGTHKPMVTREEFAKVQLLLSTKHQSPIATPERLSFTYRGLIRCGSCGAMVTAKNTVNRYGKRYVHYYCCRKERRYQYCPEGAIEERTLEAQAADFLETLRLPPSWERYALKNAAGLLETAENTKERLDQSRRQRTAELDQHLDRLRDLCVRGVISEGDYARDSQRLSQERAALQVESASGAEPPSDVELFIERFSFATEAKNAFLNASPVDRRALLSEVTWNLSLRDKTVLYEAKKPYSLYGSWWDFSSRSSWWNHVRTILLDTPDDVRKRT